MGALNAGTPPSQLTELSVRGTGTPNRRRVGRGWLVHPFLAKVPKLIGLGRIFRNKGYRSSFGGTHPKSGSRARPLSGP